MFFKRSQEQYIAGRLDHLEDLLIEAEVQADCMKVLHCDDEAEAFLRLAHKCYNTSVEISESTGVPLPAYVDLLRRELEAHS
jgi:hypothetical protein